MEKLFSHSILIAASPEIILRKISDLTQLAMWNPAISTVTPVDEVKFHVNRKTDAINSDEFMTITSGADYVSLVATGNRIDYTLTISVKAQGQTTEVTEQLDLIEQHGIKLPIRFMAPITKHAFKRNLILLKSYVETSTSHAG